MAGSPKTTSVNYQCCRSRYPCPSSRPCRAYRRCTGLPDFSCQTGARPPNACRVNYGDASGVLESRCTRGQSNQNWIQHMSEDNELLRIGTGWTRIKLRRVGTGIRLWGWPDFGGRVKLRTVRRRRRIHRTRLLVLTGITLRRRYAVWLPAATAIPAAPSRRTRCAWCNISPGRHWRRDTIRNTHGRGWNGIRRSHHRRRDDDDLRWRDRRWRSDSELGLSEQHWRGV